MLPSTVTFRASPKPCLSARRGTGHTSRVFFTESALGLHIAAAGRLGHFLFHLNSLPQNSQNLVSGLDDFVLPQTPQNAFLIDLLVVECMGLAATSMSMTSATYWRRAANLEPVAMKRIMTEMMIRAMLRERMWPKSATSASPNAERENGAWQPWRRAVCPCAELHGLPVGVLIARHVAPRAVQLISNASCFRRRLSTEYSCRVPMACPCRPARSAPFCTPGQRKSRRALKRPHRVLRLARAPYITGGDPALFAHRKCGNGHGRPDVLHIGCRRIARTAQGSGIRDGHSQTSSDALLVLMCFKRNRQEAFLSRATL